jgi:hypothetical protein
LIPPWDTFVICISKRSYYLDNTYF